MIEHLNNKHTKSYQNIFRLNQVCTEDVNLIHMDELIKLVSDFEVSLVIKDKKNGKVIDVVKNINLFKQDHIAIFISYFDYLKYLLLYRKIKRLEHYDTSLIAKYYQDVFVGHNYITKDIFNYLKKRIHKTKRILQKAIVLVKTREEINDESLTSAISFLESKKLPNKLHDLIDNVKYFYVNIPLYNILTREKTKFEFKENCRYFDDFIMNIPEDEHLICEKFLEQLFEKKLSCSNINGGYSDLFPTLNDINLTNKLLIDHSCFEIDANNVYLYKVIINNLEDISLSCVIGGLFMKKKLTANYYYYLDKHITIPITELYIYFSSHKKQTNLYKKLISNNNPMLIMKRDERRFYLIKKAINENKLSNILKIAPNSKIETYISKSKKVEFIETLQKIYNETEHKELFHSGIKNFIDKNIQLKRLITFESGRPKSI